MVLHGAPRAITDQIGYLITGILRGPISNQHYPDGIEITIPVDTTDH